MQNPERYTITAALPYTNGPIHIGHLAGVYVPADIYARYLRLNQKEVAFICGSDEHGVPITLKAKKEGITPQQVVDKYHAIIKQSFVDFGISLITIHALLRKSTMKLPQLFLKIFTRTENLSKRRPCNFTMRKRNNFWPTGS